MNNLLKSLDETQKNKLTIIVCIIIIFIFITVSIFSSTINEKNEKKSEYEYKEVVDNNRYFTVLGCASKFINYLSNQDTESILTILDNNYIEENNISDLNLYNYIDKLNNNYIYDYHGDIMYEKKISDGIFEYKVTGYLSGVDISTTFNKQYYPLVITLYENKLVFSVRPGE